MTKSELVRAVTEEIREEGEFQISQKEVLEVINTTIENITNTVANGEDVKITGFGTFKVSARKARKGINPQNISEVIEIPAMNLPSFKAGETFKRAVRNP